MELTLERYHCNSNWDDLVRDSPQENVFCYSWFLNSLEVNKDLWVVKNKNTIILGAIILTKDNIVIKSPHLLTMYQGILYSDFFSKMSTHRRVTLGLECVDFLLKELLKIYNKISFCLSPSIEDLRSFLWFNYSTPELGKFNINLRYTGIIDLSLYNSFEDYLKNIRTVRQQEYKKGFLNELKTEYTEDIELLNNLENLTFERQGLKRSELEIKNFKNIAKAAIDSKVGNILICKNRDNIVLGATLFLEDTKAAYYFAGANHPEYRKSGCGTFLLIESIRKCYDKNLKKIDMVGINSPNRGLFKVSLNALPTPYFEVDLSI